MIEQIPTGLIILGIYFVGIIISLLIYPILQKYYWEFEESFGEYVLLVVFWPIVVITIIGLCFISLIEQLNDLGN